jgi:hypothetical protein
MNKAIGMPALMLASMFVATSAWAATKPKSTSTAAAPAASQWAQMPAGNPHKLRKAVAIRSADKGDWNIKRQVTLKGGASDPQCKWAAAPSKLPSLDKATLLIDTDSAGNPWMYLLFADKTWVRRQMTFGGPTGEQTWMSSSPKDDWNYYVLFEDTKPGASLKTPIDKRYHVEVFPPEGIDANVKAHCDPERPDHAVALASVANTAKTAPCQAGTGSGGEPGPH